MPGRKNFIGTENLVRYVTPIVSIAKAINAAIKNSPTAKAEIASVPSRAKTSETAITLPMTAIGLPCITLLDKLILRVFGVGFLG
jgi:hypothetical protein